MLGQVPATSVPQLSAGLGCHDTQRTTSCTDAPCALLDDERDIERAHLSATARATAVTVAHVCDRFVKALGSATSEAVSV